MLLKSSQKLKKHRFSGNLFTDDDRLISIEKFTFTPYRILYQTPHNIIHVGVFDTDISRKICVRKSIYKPDLSRMQKVRIRREVLALSNLTHPHIVQFYCISEDDDYLDIFMEYCGIGDFHDLILSRNKIPEQEALHYFFQILSAVQFIHSHGLIHRDLKPENLLLSDPDTVKIADFGFCTSIDDNNVSSVGTFEYAAPEILAGNGYIGPEVDAWSLGCILYVLIHGTIPFACSKDGVPDSNRTYYRMQQPLMVSTDISDTTVALIRGLLRFDARHRMTIKECCEILSSSEEITSARSNSSLSSFEGFSPR